MLNSARKSLLLSVFLLTPVLLFAQEFDNGIGLRLGDPFGFTYKKYISPTRAVEFIAGTSGNGWSTNYSKNLFSASLNLMIIFTSIIGWIIRLR